MDIDFVALERHLIIRQGLALTTVKNTIKNIKRLEKEGALVSREAFEGFVLPILRRGSKSYYNTYAKAVKRYGAFTDLTWTTDLPLYQEERGNHSGFPDDVVEQLLNVPPFPNQSEKAWFKWKVFWSIAAMQGIRPVELRRLQFENVLLGKGVIIHVHSKKKTREIPIAGRILEDLTTYYNAHPGHGYFFFFRDPNVMMTEGGYLKDFRLRKKAVGLNYGEPYDMRHSFATRQLSRSKNPLFVVQDLLGHSDPKMTRIYYHDDLGAKIDAIENDTLQRKFTNPESIVKQLHEEIEKRVFEDKRFDKATVQRAIAMLYESVLK